MPAIIEPGTHSESRTHTQAVFNHPSQQGERAGDPDGARRGCPRCGSALYRRSHRGLFDRLLLRGPMARCKDCRCRFRFPATGKRIA